MTYIVSFSSAGLGLTDDYYPVNNYGWNMVGVRTFGRRLASRISPMFFIWVAKIFVNCVAIKVKLLHETPMEL